MNYFDAWKKYAVFSGRASRKEYWTFTLTTIFLIIIFRLVGSRVVEFIYEVIVALPTLAVAVRRLHDTDRSSWWLLLTLVPLVGEIILIIFYSTDSQIGENKYGPNPKNQVVQQNVTVPVSSVSSWHGFGLALTGNILLCGLGVIGLFLLALSDGPPAPGSENFITLLFLIPVCGVVVSLLALIKKMRKIVGVLLILESVFYLYPFLVNIIPSILFEYHQQNPAVPATLQAFTETSQSLVLVSGFFAIPLIMIIAAIFHLLKRNKTAQALPNITPINLIQ